MLVLNHPLGGMDAMILINALKGRRNDLKFILNDVLLSLTNISDMLVGVNKIGVQKRGQ